MRIVSLKSYAKLNLYLRVLGKLPDNYHNIITVFERVNLFDEIILQSRDDSRIRIISDNSRMPKDKSNLAYQAAHLLRKRVNSNSGVDIKIIKRIPLASGLGGGSSNAAAILIGLNRLWRLRLPIVKLVKIAQIIGADVPFFLYDSPFAIGRHRGDKIKRTGPNYKFWHVVLTPRLSVSSKLVYRQLDRLGGLKSLRLTNPLVDVKMLLLSLRKRRLGPLKKALFNHLEIPAFNLYPRLKALRDKLKDVTLRDDLIMSGSGASMFFLVASRKEGEGLCRRLRQFREWRTFLVRTI